MARVLLLIALLEGTVAQSDDCDQALRLLCRGEALQNVSLCDACLVANAALFDEYRCSNSARTAHCATSNAAEALCDDDFAHGGVDGATLRKMAGAVRVLIDGIGENADREGLVDTPRRVAKALLDLTKGSRGTTWQDVVGTALFHEDHHDMVVVKDVPLYSMCEHHMLPFFGSVSVAYIPNGTVIGLSKIARIADLYARRLQVQERLTTQIAVALEKALAPAGVMVVVTAQHMCMASRGVEKTGAATMTSATRGRFASDAQLRSEFLATL